MPEKRWNSEDPRLFFTVVFGVVAGILLLIGAIYLVNRIRKNARRQRELNNDIRHRHLRFGSHPSLNAQESFEMSSIVRRPAPTYAPESPPPSYSYPPSYMSETRGRTRERQPPPRDRLPRLNPSRTQPTDSQDDSFLRARLEALATSSGVVAPPSQPATLAPPANAFTFDEGSGQSDASEFDMERRGPAVNPAWAAQRQARDREMAAAGYTESDMMLASDQTDDADEEPAPEVNLGAQKRSGAGMIEGRDGIRMTSTSDRPKWALPDKKPEPMPTVAGIQKPLPAQAQGTNQLGGLNQPSTNPFRRHSRLSSLPTVLPGSSSRSHGPTLNRQRPNIAENLYPEYSGSGGDSVHSSRLSQADLASSSGETEQDEDVRLSRDPWWAEVIAFRRGQRRNGWE